MLRQRADLSRMAPAIATLLALGVLTGLRRRERVRAGEGYSSPLVAWVGKRVLLTGACAVGLYATGPVMADPAWLFAAAIAVAAGSAAYAGNLPARL